MRPGEPFSPKGLFTGLFVPGWLARMRLPASAKLIYGRAANLDAGTGVVEFEQAWMSSEVGVDEKTVRASIRTLATESLWRVDKVAGVARLAHRSHRYVFLWHPAMTSAAMRRGVVLTGPGEMPGPGREEAAPAGGQIARSKVVGEVELGEGPPQPPEGGDDWKPTHVGRQKVTDAERELTDGILAELNRALETSYTGAVEHRRAIIGRIREHPQVDLAAHGRLIRANAAAPWWKGAPGPEVIYGNAGQFEKAIEVAKAARSRPGLAAVPERPRLTADEETLRDLEAWLAHTDLTADERQAAERDAAALRERVAGTQEARAS